MIDVLVVAGARPNFMKVKPVLHGLQDLGLTFLLVHTGQHYDAEMSDVFFDDLGLDPPDRFLGAGSGTHSQQTAAVMTAMEEVVAEVEPRAVVVPGDVNSSLAAAIVAAKAGCRVAHVEAGLRSRDWTMPEEINRVVIDRVSDLLLAPSPDAVENLQDEGYGDDQIVLVGNVMADTLRDRVDEARDRPILADLGLVTGEYVLVTLHRPANVDDPADLAGLVGALDEIATDLPVVFPVHPRTRSHLGTVSPGVTLLGPQGYLDFIALMSGAACVVTDSGGVQEETTVLGVPCLTVRDNTERPITIEAGTNRLVGRRPADVVAAYHAVRVNPPVPRCPELWDGKAGFRSAQAIADILDEPGRRRPTERRPAVDW